MWGRVADRGRLIRSPWCLVQTVKETLGLVRCFSADGRLRISTRAKADRLLIVWIFIQERELIPKHPPPDFRNAGLHSTGLHSEPASALQVPPSLSVRFFLFLSLSPLVLLLLLLLVPPLGRGGVPFLSGLGSQSGSHSGLGSPCVCLMRHCMHKESTSGSILC